jgi:SAM-dependent methyltransferase
MYSVIEKKRIKSIDRSVVMTPGRWVQKFYTGVKVLWSLARGKAPDPTESFECLYLFKKDPWNYEKSEYERIKYESTVGILPRRIYNKALEIACSEGVLTSLIAEKANHVLGVDISPTAIERAKERFNDNPQIDFKIANAEETEFDEQYDLIVCSEMLYYLDDIDRITVLRDKLINSMETGGHIVLCHMRRTGDDDEGYPPPLVGYPAMGANTVHGIFKKSKTIKMIDEIKRPLYTITLFEKL